jgi:predicted transcriptional regulator
MRSPAEVRHLEQLVLTVVRMVPRITRAEIATVLGVTPDAIHRPVTNLLHAGRITRQGHREKTSYVVAPDGGRTEAAGGG